MIELSNGTQIEYRSDEHKCGMYVVFDGADGGYKLQNRDIIEESLELEESLISNNKLKMNAANAASIKFSFFTDSALGVLDIVGKKFKAYHYCKPIVQEGAFTLGNSLFGGKLATNADRLKPLIEQAIDQLDNQTLERYYGIAEKVFEYDWEFANYSVTRRWDSEAQEYYVVATPIIRTGHGSYTYINPSMMDSDQLYYAASLNARFLWGNTNYNMVAYVDEAKSYVVAYEPPEYTVDPAHEVLTPVTYKAYASNRNSAAVAAGYAGKCLMSLRILLRDVPYDPNNDGSYNLRIRQLDASQNRITGAETIALVIPAEGVIETEVVFEMDASCALLQAEIYSDNDSGDVLWSGDMSYTSCELYPLELVPLGYFTVSDCPVVYNDEKARSLTAYNGLYSEDLDREIPVDNTSVNTIGDLLDNYVTPVTGLTFGNEKYYIAKALNRHNTYDEVEYTATYPNGMVEKITLGTTWFDITSYDSSLQYDLIKRTFNDGLCATRFLRDVEEQYGIYQLVTKYDDDGKANPLFNEDYYSEHIAIQNAMQNAAFYTHSAIGSDGKFTITTLNKVEITPPAAGAAYVEVIGNRGCSPAGIIDMSSPLVPLVDDLGKSEDYYYFESIKIYAANSGGVKELDRGGNIKKPPYRYYYDIYPADYAFKLYRTQEFTFQGNFGQPVTVKFCTASYKFYFMAMREWSGTREWATIPTDEYVECKVRPELKDIPDRIYNEILGLLYKANIYSPGTGDCYNSDDDSVLSSLRSAINSATTTSSFRVYGDNESTYRQEGTAYYFLMPLSYIVTRYKSDSPSSEARTFQPGACNYSAAYEWHSSNTLFEKALSSGSSYTVTPRELVGAYAELCGQFFAVDREGNPQLKSLPELLMGIGCPDPGLFPSTDIYPGAKPATTLDNAYVEKITYYETATTIKYKGVRIYKNKALVKTAYISGAPADGLFYDVIDNPIIDNYTFSSSDLDDICDLIIESIEKITLYNCESQIVGLPYLELGDMLALEYGQLSIYVLNRKLKGVTALKDQHNNRVL